jgi:hypothetical protein
VQQRNSAEEGEVNAYGCQVWLAGHNHCGVQVTS